MKVQCCVAGEGSNGPDLWFVVIDCTNEQYENGDHYIAAKEWATSQDIDGPYVVFDENDPPGNNLMKLFIWASATVYPCEKRHQLSCDSKSS